ncbi:MAG: hypothetical protein EOM85_03435 [Candidatus Moranbacteria bacterium]|nr:hypothetical protein [Candidatus Moranbacteria bacterium]
MLDNKTKKLMKKVMKVMKCDKSIDKLEFGISDKPRRIYNEDGDGYYEFGIYDVAGMTDEEIQEVVNDMQYEYCGCNYDCCGHPFTQYIEHKRLNNNKISIVHSVGFNY